MTQDRAEAILEELKDELGLDGFKFIDRDKYAIQVSLLTGGGSVTLGEHVIGGYMGKTVLIPVRSTELTFDVMHTLRTKLERL